MITELKPCPFCGGEPIKRRTRLDERFGYADQINIYCRYCGVEMVRMGDCSNSDYADNSDVETETVSDWNRRTTPTADDLRKECGAVLAGLGPVYARLMMEGYEGSAKAVLDASELISAFRDAQGGPNQ